MALERNQLNTTALCGASVFSGVCPVPLAPVKSFLLFPQSLMPPTSANGREKSDQFALNVSKQLLVTNFCFAFKNVLINTLP